MEYMEETSEAIGCDLDAGFSSFVFSLCGKDCRVEIFYGARMIRGSRDAAGTQKNVVGRRSAVGLVAYWYLLDENDSIRSMHLTSVINEYECAPTVDS